jgi:hypothetical protein
MTTGGTGGLPVIDVQRAHMRMQVGPLYRNVLPFLPLRATHNNLSFTPINMHVNRCKPYSPSVGSLKSLTRQGNACLDSPVESALTVRL